MNSRRSSFDHLVGTGEQGRWSMFIDLSAMARLVYCAEAFHHGCLESIKTNKIRARFRATIDPSVIGRLLDDDIACLHVHNRAVQHHVSLAGQDNGIINRSSAMHHRMLHGKPPGWRVISDHLSS